MVRHLVCSLVVVALVVGVTLAQEKKPAATKVSGTFVSFKEGTLTINVKSKDDKEGKPMEFKVGADLKVTTFKGDAKSEVVAADAFKTAEKGAMVTVTVDDAKKVTAVQIGAPAKKPAK